MLFTHKHRKNSPASEADILSFAIDDAFIWIKQDSLSQQETSLLKALFPVINDQKNTHGITIFLKMLLVFKKKLSFDPASRRIKRRILKKNGKILFWNYFAILLISFYTDTDALLVEQINRDYLDATEINGIFYL